MLFIRGDLPCKLLSVENQPMEGYVELNLRKTKHMVALLLLELK